jgi:twitching motility protein PilT
MKTTGVDVYHDQIVRALARSPLFSALDEATLGQVARLGELVQFSAGEALLRQGAPADAFLVLLKGEARVLVHGEGRAPATEVARLTPPELAGETGLLLDQPRTASVEAIEPVIAVRYDTQTFLAMFDRVRGFGLAVSRSLALRLSKAAQTMPLPEYDEATSAPDPETLRALPAALCTRQRVVPLRFAEGVLTLGVVDDPKGFVLDSIRQVLPGAEIRPVRVTAALLDRLLRSLAGAGANSRPATTTTAPTPAPTKAVDGGRVRDLAPLLARVVEEGVSDLHLSAGQRPRWRLDGEIVELADSAPLEADDVLALLQPWMAPRPAAQFRDTNDTDFSFALPGLARFRVNLFRNHLGVSAVLRQIPDKVLSLEQLNLPPAVAQFCELPRGLVLVSGPTGSGKSTTLAAMLDAINRKECGHILTLEDPIEFVHRSQRSLVNQREIGSQTDSFARALRAALREDPDVVLVGEMRDLETVALALEVANTGHLVFGTLHTNTAVGCVDRVVNQFPPEQQAQVRSTLADVLKGVVCQTLCRRVGGGRVAAVEILVVNFGVANQIREGKTHQIPSLMATGRAQGNLILNQHLEELVRKRLIEPKEALANAVDKTDLGRRLGGEG